jgi:predicted glycoside hydrolase/deacetylase ChbG (UPF0249 family)
MIIINADDWGRTEAETDAALFFAQEGKITSISAMVFMEDSIRAAALSKSLELDIGLHLNFSQKFTGKGISGELFESQKRIARFLTRNKFSLLVYNPFLRKQFRCTFQEQLGEFIRLYGRKPSHINGHHHLHLCTNMLMDRVIDKGEKVRRSFSFLPGEKNIFNRAYRHLVDRHLAVNFRVTDYFFDLPGQYKKDRLKRVSQLAKSVIVELMTHPAVPEDFSILSHRNYLDALKDLPMGSYALL